MANITGVITSRKNTGDVTARSPECTGQTDRNPVVTMTAEVINWLEGRITEDGEARIYESGIGIILDG